MFLICLLDLGDINDRLAVDIVSKHSQEDMLCLEKIAIPDARIRPILSSLSIKNCTWKCKVINSFRREKKLYRLLIRLMRENQ